MRNEKFFFHQRYWYFRRYDSLINKLILFRFSHVCLKPKFLIRAHPLKKCLLMWTCSLQVHAVCFASYRLKYRLLIGGIRLTRNFVVACTTRLTGWNARGFHYYVCIMFLKKSITDISATVCNDTLKWATLSPLRANFSLAWGQCLGTGV